MNWHEEHKKLWEWLAENPGKKKIDYFIAKGLESPPNNCFACLVGKLAFDRCKCPIDWGEEKDFACELGDSPYKEWRDIMSIYEFGDQFDEELSQDISFNRLTELATRIANMPLRKDVDGQK